MVAGRGTSARGRQRRAAIGRIDGRHARDRGVGGRQVAGLPFDERQRDTRRRDSWAVRVSPRRGPCAHRTRCHCWPVPPPDADDRSCSPAQPIRVRSTRPPHRPTSGAFQALDLSGAQFNRIDRVRREVGERGERRVRASALTSRFIGLDEQSKRRGIVGLALEQCVQRDRSPAWTRRGGCTDC